MSKYEIKPTDTSIDDVLNKCIEAEAHNRTAFGGMTYEEGVRAGIDWLVGNEEEKPLD